MDVCKMIDDYMTQRDWRVKENSNSPYNFGSMNKYVIGNVSKEYWAERVYDERARNAHNYGFLHIHDMSGLTLYCCGYSLQKILSMGIRGISNIPTSAPPKHFDAALNQIANILTIFQNEILGAVALSSFDTLLAPYVAKDNLSFKDVKQSMQNFVYSVNSNSRAGAEPAFTNITFDLFCPKDLAETPVNIAGQLQTYGFGIHSQVAFYKDFQKEMDMINKAFFEIMLEGDAEGKPFAYPIPTYSIMKGFDWDNPNNELLWEMTGKYGYPYFSNYINSDMEPSDVRAMCPLTGDTLVMVRRHGKVSIEPICDIKGDVEVWTGKKWVKGHHVEMPATPIVHIELSNGTEVNMGVNHLQPLGDGKTTVKASELKVGQWLPFNGRVIETQPVDDKDYELGKAVGAFCGDGNYGDHLDNCINYSLNDTTKLDLLKDLNDFWTSMGCTTREYYNGHCLSLGVGSPSGAIISKYVVGHNALEKGLTDAAFNASEDFKRGLIEGYYLTDGARARKRIATSSNSMRHDMQMLLSSIGRKALINYADTRPGRLGTNPNYRIDMPERTKYGNFYNTNGDYNLYQITEAYIVDNTEPLYCFEVEDDSHLFMLANGLITHNCRLRLDLTELRRRNGGLFGSGDSTGSIGVVTLNLPRLGYMSKNKQHLFALIREYMDIAKDSLEDKRNWLQMHIVGTGMIPAFDTYVGTVENHFSTIGLVGLNEMIENCSWMQNVSEDINILDYRGKKLAEEVLDYMRDTLIEYQQMTGHLYNLEATPAESTCYRLAKLDKKEYPDIKTQGSGQNVYYTNSCHIPVAMNPGFVKTLEHQDSLQCKFTGGTVVHLFAEAGINGNAVKEVIRHTCENHKLPYVTYSPVIKLCPEHGYFDARMDKCPVCGASPKVLQRITGYIREIPNYNPGKLQEFKDRKQNKVEVMTEALKEE